MRQLKELFATLVTASFVCLPFATAASPAIDLAKQLNQAFIETADKASASVVVIDVVQSSTDYSLGNSSTWEMLPPGLRRRFREQFEEQPPEKTQGQGSGVILREDGYILTNRHVVEDAETITVRLKDGRRFKAVVRGTDPQSDLAVIKIDAKGLPAAKLGDSSQTRVGEFSIAIGAPFNLDYSVTFGHISGKGRRAIYGEEGMSMDQDFLQTDANINPGNSGGPLVNLNAEVIGINTLIHGLRTGIGFAIPINLAREVADKLIADGKFPRVWLGIAISTLNDVEDIRELFPGASEGVLVTAIDRDGPAAKSELHAADVITSIDGVTVSTSQQLKAEVRRKKNGQTVTLEVMRHGKPLKIQTQVEEKAGEPYPDAQPAVSHPEHRSRLGLAVQPLSRGLAEEFRTPVSSGVLVTEVERGGLASRCGLQPGDVITEIGQQPISSLDEFKSALKRANFTKGVLVNVTSPDGRRFVVLRDND